MPAQKQNFAVALLVDRSTRAPLHYRRLWHSDAHPPRDFLRRISATVPERDRPYRTQPQMFLGHSGPEAVSILSKPRMFALCRPTLCHSTHSRAKRVTSSTVAALCPHRCLYSRCLFFFASDRQAGLNPVLLAAGIMNEIRVAHCRQFTGGVLGSMSRK